MGTVRVLNRSLERARALAERTQAEAGDLDQLPAALREADLVVSATGATGVVLTGAMLETALEGRDRPVFVLDLGVPRDVEPSAREIDGVTLLDIDDLRRSVEVRTAELAEDIESAHAIVGEEVRRLTLRRRSEHLAPLYRALRERGDAVVGAELERFRSDLALLTPDEREAVEALARGIVAKLLHEPIVRLKELPTPGSADANARMLVELFGLELPPE